MTKETEMAFAILYCEYKRRRSFGTAKQDAVCFEDAKILKIDAFSDWNPADVSYAMQQLKTAKYVRINILGDVTLLDSGIEFMEKKPLDYFEIVSKFFNLVAILGTFAGA